MPTDVEKFSDYGNRNRRGLLGGQEASEARQSRPMDAALHKRRVGENLKMAREALGLSQPQLATRFSLGDDSKVSNWERGLNYPDPFFIWRLWQEERITADWVYLRQTRGLPSDLADSLREAAKVMEGAAQPEASGPAPKRPVGRPKKATSRLPAS